MTESAAPERPYKLHLSAWIRIHERLAEDERRREKEIVVMRPVRAKETPA